MSKSISRYDGADLVIDSSGNWISPNEPFVDTSPQKDDKIHVVAENERLDLLAREYLHDARLWWVIAEYNDIPWMFDLTVGMQLRIPSYEHAYMDLLS